MKKSIVYTRTGDTGTTSLVGGARETKHSERLEAYGTIDELNSHIGLLAAIEPYTSDNHILPTLLDIQQHLFNIGGYLACSPDSKFQLPPGVDTDTIRALENTIDILDNTLPPINNFVLPGGTAAAAHTHIARSVCRRAERRIVALNTAATVDPKVTAYINRLSDFLFILARYACLKQGANEIFWQKP